MDNLEFDENFFASDIFSNLPNDLTDTSSIRYFTPDFQKEVENSPNDVQIWLKWAIFTLNDFSTYFGNFSDKFSIIFFFIRNRPLFV